MRKFLYLGPVAALALLALPSVASAGLMFTDGVTPADILFLNTGGTITDGSSLGPTIATIAGGMVYGSSVSGAAEPVGTQGNFYATGPSSGSPALLNFVSPVSYFSFLVGSPDTYNSLSFIIDTGGTFSTVNYTDPSDFGVNPLTGNQMYSQYVNFYTTAGSVIDSVSFGSSTDAFEVSNFSVSAVPEASTWAMMIMGFLGLGFLGYRKSSGSSFRVA
jgi:hypothetical protein